MERMHWTDGRLDEKMESIDRTFEMIQGELAAMRLEIRTELGALRSEMREEIGGLRTEMRQELGALRSDFNSLQRQLIHVGFAMIGVMIAAFTAVIVAIA